jgi:hypothetical protein
MGNLFSITVGCRVSRAIIVSVNGVTQAPADFITKGHKIVFKDPPDPGDNVQFTTVTGSGINTSSYYGTGTQTIFNLPAFPRAKFEVIKDSDEPVPPGYTVVDVDNEIDFWIRHNCQPYEWKWADQIGDPAIQFGMTRLIIKDSVLTFIATKWSA